MAPLAEKIGNVLPFYFSNSFRTFWNVTTKLSFQRCNINNFGKLISTSQQTHVRLFAYSYTGDTLCKFNYSQEIYAISLTLLITQMDLTHLNKLNQCTTAT